MEINWFTLVAQAINFIILVILLKRFLYRPIVSAMEEREARVASRLREADEKRALATQEAESLQQERQEWEAKRGEMLASAREETEEYKKKLLQEARQAVEAAHQSWQQSVERESEEVLQDLQQSLSRQVSEVARRALKDLAGVELEQRVVEVFAARLQGIDEEKKEAIAKAIRGSNDKVLVRIAADIPMELRHNLVEAIQAHILDGEGVDTRFEIAPTLIAGVELQVRGYRIAWTLEDYLKSLEEQLRLAILERTTEAV